jgi:SAM-dependent methyltransferase
MAAGEQVDWRSRCLAVENDFGVLLASLDRLPISPFVDNLLIRALEGCWLRPEQLVAATVDYLTAKWPRALKGTPLPGESQVFDLARDPVLLAMLRMTPAATPRLDILLAQLRFGVLHQFMTGGDVTSFAPTMVALAVRGWHSGYAATLPLGPRYEGDTALEGQMVACLGQRLADGLVANDPHIDRLERDVIAPNHRQRAIARDLVSLTPLDASSALVAGQYEIHPYPAWVGEPSSDMELPSGVRAVIDPTAVRSVLVAGCGTGQHALAAATAWPRAEVLAIDISRSSLAYAIDQAGGIAPDRVTFALADLLQADRLGRRFDVIETMGVLHHLEDPDTGLRALAQVMAPGGLIGIGLYSRAARSELDRIRGSYGTADMSSDAAVRRFRAWALTDLARSELLYSPDFYSLGGVRDAFFHVRERCYALPQIGDMIERAGLQLVTIAKPARTDEWLSHSPAGDDLAGWDAAEQEFPELFLGMYEVWAQKPTS